MLKIRPYILLAFGALTFAFQSRAEAQNASMETSMRDAGAEVYVYKECQTADGKPVSLNLYVFSPEDHQAPEDHPDAARRPAIVFFFGGGWRSGRPSQFTEHCKYLASRGMVAMTADYRVSSRHGTKAIACVADGKSAVRWIREHAEELGIDPERVAAGGGSAGGHVAACTGVIEGSEAPGEDTSVSSRPDALALFNPALVLAKVDDRPPLDPDRVSGLADRMGVPPRQLSPIHHVSGSAPPTIIFHGRDDKTVAFWTAEAFCDAMKEAGNRCELVGFDGQGHGFFNHGRGDNSNYQKTIDALDKFLVSIGFLM